MENYILESKLMLFQAECLGVLFIPGVLVILVGIFERRLIASMGFWRLLLGSYPLVLVLFLAHESWKCKQGYGYVSFLNIGWLQGFFYSAYGVEAACICSSRNNRLFVTAIMLVEQGILALSILFDGATATGGWL
jgi:hypothetical protein